MNVRSILSLLVSLILALACAMAEPAAPDAPDEGRLTPEQIASKVLSAMDREADPCEDFYRYACGGWIDATELPPDESRWSRSFSVIHEENRTLVREILESATADPGDDPDQRLVGRFYGSCMAEGDVERAGARPLKPIFREIGKVKDAGTLLAVTAKLHRMNVGALFDIGVIPDFKNPDLNIAFMAQGGLGMPDRDYYLSEDETKHKLLEDYEKHVARMFALLG